jgi:hypothetical protein
MPLLTVAPRFGGRPAQPGHEGVRVRAQQRVGARSSSEGRRALRISDPIR